ncbi:MAG: hypothetical protein VYD57_05930 [Pseudomonadota bacterium]|nr:hypothetical protein [Pseudomonadota bacterium]
MVGALGDEAQAGAWTQEAGHGQAIVTGLYSASEDGFDTAKTGLETDYTKGTVSLFLDYGLLDGLTLTAAAEMGAEQFGALPLARPGLTKTQAGARMRLHRSDRLAMTAGIAVIAEDAHGAADRLVDTFGWDAPMLEARWSGGVNFAVLNRSAFAEVSLGYRYRIGEGPDEVVADATIGAHLAERWMLIAQSFSTISTGFERPEADYAFHKAQGSVVYRLNKRWSVQAGAFATVAGHNALKERGVITALWYDF